MSLRLRGVLSQPQQLVELVLGLSCLGIGWLLAHAVESRQRLPLRTVRLTTAGGGSAPGRVRLHWLVPARWW